MEWSWWFGRSNKKNQTPNESLHKEEEEEEEEQLLGFTQQLIDHVNSFTLHTFLNFPLKDESSNSTDAANSDNVQKDLSNWQERHATLVLSKLKELSQLRFKLCPRHLKERDFWRIYFLLVKSHVSVYEVRAIQVAKIKRMAIEKDEYSDTTAFEVEMSETKHAASSDPPTP